MQRSKKNTQLIHIVSHQSKIGVKIIKKMNNFNHVVKSAASPFEMQFNARINRAFLGRDEKVKWML